MKLVVGLGNPDKKYENTRHNCGFMALDYYATKNNLTYKKKYDSFYAENVVNNEKIILVKPLTYMNLSGNAVRKFVNFYNIELENILVIYDDVDFELGKFKIKRAGSSGGHNGINSIINVLGTKNIQRIRIGISKTKEELISYVLGNFSKEENQKINEIMPIISNIIDDFSNNDINKLMEKYNKINE
jgi:PTH1 family peptidyl-tRNA hydrolase